MNILQRSMASQGILNDTQTTLADYLMSIAQISVEDAGAIYIELSSIRGNFMANIILRMIENYHFLPDMAQKLKNKQALVESVIANEQLEPSITLSIKDVYDDLCPADGRGRAHPSAGRLAQGCGPKLRLGRALIVFAQLYGSRTKYFLIVYFLLTFCYKTLY